MNEIVVGLSLLVVAGVIIAWQLQAFQLRVKIRQLNASINELNAATASSQELMDTFLSSVDRAIFVVDENLHVTRANMMSQKWLLLEIGKTLIEETLSIEMVECVRSTISSGEEHATEFIFGSERRPVSVKCVPMKSGALCIAEDVFEMRRLESARRDFVANVSHELRTPLASIRAMAETLQSGARKDEEVADRFLETIVSESDRLTRIAEDLLILSRAESREPEKTAFDLSTVVKEVAQRFSFQSKSSGVFLKTDLEPGLKVFASRDQIEQAVVNLVDNAINYSHRESTVTIQTRRDETSAILSVEDTGIGVLAADIPRLFERFYRVDKARSRKSGGTGLGLSIVKHVVESNGGKIEVESEYNHGSKFSIRLPAME